MAVSGLDHINLQAPQDALRTARDFYVDVIGLSEGGRPGFRRPGYWLYAGDHPILHLTEEVSAPTGTTCTTQDHVAFACGDAHAMKVRLETAGVPFQCKEVPGKGILQIFLHDPLGNGVELNFGEGSC
ncbi:diguanylate cyclase [Burkholderiaceae bacterium DAT-1]|nr:diguanylate cyclase [Burkholderiaceae bacterium DAT-1]